MSQLEQGADVGVASPPSVVLVGNPNAGKTSLFNAMTGLRAKTANFPGITVDLRYGPLRGSTTRATVIDLPGLYSLDPVSVEEKVAASALHGETSIGEPSLIVIVVDATNVERHLMLASEILDLRRPTVVALNLIDAANSEQISVDRDQLSSELGCPVVPVSARTGQGVDELCRLIDDSLGDPLKILNTEHESCTAGCTGCTFAARFEWAEQVAERSVTAPQNAAEKRSQTDALTTHPLFGVLVFLSVMLGVFYVIFALADVPMTLIDETFGAIGAAAESVIPAVQPNRFAWAAGVIPGCLVLAALVIRLAGGGWSQRRAVVAGVIALIVGLLPIDDFRSLVVDGIVGGVGGVIIFLPQICILFFFISLLEDSGYMARAAFVMERLMRAVGLPGRAFVPMLSAHACAIPGIMAARIIENWRDRLVTILVLPLLTCSARLPVYAMVAALLFADEPRNASLVFVGAYMLGIAAALGSAWCLKKTILQGETAPLILELPPYRMPSLRNALLTVYDRGWIFVRKAGSVILVISVVLWFAARYPQLSDEDVTALAEAELAAIALEIEDAEDDEAKAEAEAKSEQVFARERLANSFAGRLGRFVEPVFAPLGFDWKINVGVLSSFAAREVIVSTLAIVYGIGEDAAEDESTLVETLERQERDDGTPVYTTATCMSLLVFYVLAMQCLPTQAVTKRETGSWKWALFQLAFMTILAYVAALAAFQITRAAGID